ncbi:MAG: copper resistance protein CopC [Enhydrobacter sp.]|nr:copper resistance protein CopC [Enhydrobacter sp.]
MIARRLFTSAAAALVAGAAGSATAQVPKVVETMPAAQAVLTNAGGEFYVRFDRPVDHIRSMMYVKQDGVVIRTLHPRFKTEPNVLFAMAPPLPPGPYTFVWSVRSLEGADVLDGELPFSVSAPR